VSKKIAVNQMLKTTTLRTHITIIIKNKPAESKKIAVGFII
jgi:hypothetical protein